MDPQPNFLDSLNAAQLRAATNSPNIPLQILAGPGSGKTRVLTSRIAHLILNCHLSPSSICAVTFTNKAANEMRERLIKLIGKERTSQLRMGTFHSLCTRFLRRYSLLVDVPENFTVCDAAESKKLIANLLKPFATEIKAASLSLEPGTVASMISKAKSQGQSAESYLKKAKESERLAREKYGVNNGVRSVERIVGEIYIGYESTLKRNKALDFDDLLIYGVKLFTRNEETVLWCRHILVDEFQDTNVTQYQLMHALGHAHCVSIVGDPDQSIYGWRSADVGNLSKMRKDFPQTTQVLLEENYRSTGGILKASLAIVSQDPNRLDKSLYTSHPDGFTPILYQVDSEHEEAAFIAIEIKRLVAEMGGTLRWGDFVVLLRFNALSRAIESALQKERIPSRVLGGHKFFERLEVKDLLAYLQLVDNPNFGPAFIRAVNVPGRGVGEKTLADITTRAEQSKKSQLEIIEGIYDIKIPDNKPTIRKKIAPFVVVIRTLRGLAAEGTSPADLIRKLIDLTQYEEHLKKTQSDWETRWENVKELITFASEVEERNKAENSAATEEENELELDANNSPLRQFLQASMLSSEGDNQSEEDNNDKVTISTCHSAKGLEWPVVMVPSVDSTTYPFIRSEDEDEERRLLYVACTRAKSLLYITRSTRRMVAGETKSKALSTFISTILENNHSDGKTAFFNQNIPVFEPQDRAVICRVLERPLPDESEVRRRVAEFERSGRQHPLPFYWTHLSAAPRPQPATSGQSSGSYTYNMSSGSNSTFVTMSQVSHLQHQFISASSTLQAQAPSSNAVSQQSYNSLPHPQTTFRPSLQPHFQTLDLPFAQGSAASSSKRVRAHDSTLQDYQAASTQGQLASSSQSEAFRSPQSEPPPQSARTRTMVSKPRHESASLSDAGNNRLSTTPLSRESPAAPTLQTLGFRQPFATHKDPPLQSNIQNPEQTMIDQNCPPTATVAAMQIPTLKASSITASSSSPVPVTTTLGVKRRLGMGRTTGGYSNKKFKPPT